MSLYCAKFKVSRKYRSGNTGIAHTWVKGHGQGQGHCDLDLICDTDIVIVCHIQCHLGI